MLLRSLPTATDFVHLAHTFDSSFEISMIPNGVDLELYKTGEHDWSSPRLLSVGRIVHQKGLDLAMHALGGLKDLNWEWRIAGDGPQMQALQSLAQELGIDDRVFFLGWQSREQIIESYRQANVFLFPSRHEGMPNAILEAMASGLPVIATCIAGNEELVIEGQTGYLVPSEDIEALQNALKKILKDLLSVSKWALPLVAAWKKTIAGSLLRNNTRFTWKR